MDETIINQAVRNLATERLRIITRLEAESKELLKYVDHYGTCPMPKGVCDCGLTELLASK